MNKMVGKISNKDWDKAPEGATHTFRHKYEDAHPQDGYYKLKDGKIYYWRTVGDWWDATTHSHLELAVYCISKEEDLRMNVKTKVVKGVEDLELGLFLKDDSGNIVVVTRNCGKVSGKSFYTCCNTGNGNVAQNGAGETFYNNFISWSYTYSGEYTPIVKETEAEKKIKELEATIALAQKQLEEYKEMK
jgi:hypothetical protein